MIQAAACGLKAILKQRFTSEVSAGEEDAAEQGQCQRRWREAELLHPAADCFPSKEIAGVNEERGCLKIPKVFYQTVSAFGVGDSRA